MLRISAVVTGTVLLISPACSGGGSEVGVVAIGGANSVATAGSPANDAATTRGGTSSGGLPSTGGNTPSGGAPQAGGTVPVGGSVATGGLTSSGGAASRGGSSSSSKSTGGSQLSGGTAGRGGGGTTSTGGSTAAGTVARGGTSAAGGTSASGGTVTGGGTTAKGGTYSGGTAGSISTNTPTAAQAVANMGKGFNLGQMFESTQHERSLAAASAKIDADYSKGFRTVRIPITWTENVGGDRLVNDPAVGDVNRSHARLDVMKKVIDYALSKTNLYVIINAHHETTLKTESRCNVLERLWSDIADIFSARDHRLLFEILNEPNQAAASPAAMPAATLHGMTATAYGKIRAIDANRLVIMGGNQWFAASEMATVWTNLDGVGGGQDAYVMATFHHHNPWNFCGNDQGAYNDAWTDANVFGPMETMRTWANSVGKGMPFFIGDWGVAWAYRYAAMDCNNI